ncbi:hypothetical protein [Mycobacteroides salmoniphilum]|uniref:hypothetical protein n=1 Tax=Mycobacteroides salmoniphilum TaxID=404941 RepID=UPI001064DFFC|nr:hypothetical protein [Mycobacteroides salmoniphilum]TDZ76890.1 hypothetical protein DE4586_02676 [Mycobacteroides salmoniphilum]TDZ86593.1 hypothetical protein DE4587_01980 [Mycobacteroides salmoniphilum]
MTEHRPDTERPTLSGLLAILTKLAAWFLPTMIRILAGGMLLFGLIAVVVCSVGLDILWLNTFGRWNHSHGMDAAGAMLGIVYVVWAAFLWKVASNPYQNHLFINFTIAGNAAHFSLMTIMALYMPGDFHHMYMDILYGWSGVVPLAIMWWLANREAARTGAHALPAAAQPS